MSLFVDVPFSARGPPTGDLRLRSSKTLHVTAEGFFVLLVGAWLFGLPEVRLSPPCPAQGILYRCEQRKRRFGSTGVGL